MRLTCVGWWLAALLWPAASNADVTMSPPSAPASIPPSPRAASAAWHTPVPDGTLGRTRAGFEPPPGALVLGVEVQRQVWVDGVPAPDLALPGGVAPGATVIQNTLDQQRLQVLTTLNVTANSLQLFQGSALQSAVGGALAASTRR